MFRKSPFFKIYACFIDLSVIFEHARKCHLPLSKGRLTTLSTDSNSTSGFPEVLFFALSAPSGHLSQRERPEAVAKGLRGYFTLLVIVVDRAVGMGCDKILYRFFAELGVIADVQFHHAVHGDLLQINVLEHGIGKIQLLQLGQS